MASKDEKRLIIAREELGCRLIRPILAIVADYAIMDELDKIRVVFKGSDSKDELSFYCNLYNNTDLRFQIHIIGDTLDAFIRAYYDNRIHDTKTHNVAQFLPKYRLKCVINNWVFNRHVIADLIEQYVAKMVELMADV